MKRKLYSELRTIYETDPSDPHTYRITIKMKDIVNAGILKKAADTAMERYPYFRVRMRMDNGELCFEDNPAPVPVIHTNERITLGSAQTSGHLLAFCCWKNRIFIDVYHGLTDGGGISPMIRTLLYYYCSLFYEKELSSECVRLCDGAVLPEELEDPGRKSLSAKKTGMIAKWHAPALQLQDEGIHLKDDGIVYNIRIAEKEFMRFSTAHDGSPAAITALLLSRAIDELYPDAAKPPVMAMCVNQRRALQAPHAHQSLVGDVRLPFTKRMRSMSFTEQATCFRGMVILQADDDMVLDEIRDYQALMKDLAPLNTEERRTVCRNRMKDLSACITAVISYVGKADLCEAEQYIQEYEALPSTALPSLHVPLTIEISAVHGYFFMNFIQYFEADDCLNAFIRQLRRYNINYDVLNTTEALWPRMELPF